MKNIEKIKIPCDLGDCVYRVRRDRRIKKPDECEVTGIWLSADGYSHRVHLYCNKGKDNWYTIALPFNEFGHTLFLNEQEALEVIRER